MSLTPPDNQSDDFKIVWDLHARFHREAGRILLLAIEGNRREATEALYLTSQYTKISSKLMVAMNGWKAKL